MRLSNRTVDSLRKVTLEPGAALHAEGSCLVKFGNTHVLVTASLEEKAPPFLKGSGKGWVTAEYGMLPRSTHDRMRREAAAGKQSGRTQEIQRLVGRSLRAVCDLAALGERQITIELKPAAKELMLEEGFDPAYGARPLRRTIQRLVQDPLALRILEGAILPGDHVIVDRDGKSDVMRFERKEAKQPAAAARI